MELSKRINNLGTGVFQRNDFRKQSYRSLPEGEQPFPLVDLSLGASDLLPPSSVLEVMKNALFEPESSSYCLHAATYPFREAVAAWAKGRFGVEVDPVDEVLLLIGSQEGTAHLPLAVLDAGDTGLIMDPSYPSHKGGLLLAEAHIEKLLLKEEQSWRPDFKSLSISQLEQIKMMIFGYPHNPTAQVGKQSWLEEAMSLGVKNQIVIAHDNPYVELSLIGNAPSLLFCQGWRDWGIEFFSLSKGWNMGGFRIAFAIGAKHLIKALRSLKGTVDFNQSLALQKGGIEALLRSADWPKHLLSIYKERRDKTLKGLQGFGWHVSTPSMAMYLWMPIPKWASSHGWDDEDVSAELLKKTGIALTPGSGFGDGGKGMLRLALVRPVDELESAIARIEPWWHAHS